MPHRIPGFYWIVQTIDDSYQIAYYDGVYFTLTGESKKYAPTAIHMIYEEPIEAPIF